MAIWQQRVWWPLDGFAGLHAAAFVGDCDEVAACLAAGADANAAAEWTVGSSAFACTPVVVAALRGQAAAARALVGRGADPSLPATLTLEERGVRPAPCTADAHAWAERVLGGPARARVLAALRGEAAGPEASEDTGAGGRMVKLCVAIDGGGMVCGALPAGATVGDARAMLQRCGHDPSRRLRCGAAELADDDAAPLATWAAPDPPGTAACLHAVSLQLA